MTCKSLAPCVREENDVYDIYDVLHRQRELFQTSPGNVIIAETLLLGFSILNPKAVLSFLTGTLIFVAYAVGVEFYL